MNAHSQIYPRSFARFYDLIYHQERDGVDKEFFLKEIEKTKGKVLEIGVGTGRLFVEAIRQGADIYGIDISFPMLEVCAQKLDKDQEKRIFLDNIVDFDLGIKFDLIIAPFRVFMHLLRKEEQINALLNVYRNLNPGGFFVFDTFIPDLTQLVNGIDKFVDFKDEYEPGKLLKRTISTNPDLIHQIIEVDFRLDWEEESGPKHDEWKMPLRYLFRYELEHLIERFKFSNYTIRGDYKGSELNNDSKDFIVICEK